MARVGETKKGDEIKEKEKEETENEKKEGHKEKEITEEEKQTKEKQPKEENNKKEVQKNDDAEINEKAEKEIERRIRKKEKDEVKQKEEEKRKIQLEEAQRARKERHEKMKEERRKNEQLQEEKKETERIQEETRKQKRKDLIHGVKDNITMDRSNVKNKDKATQRLYEYNQSKQNYDPNLNQDQSESREMRRVDMIDYLSEIYSHKDDKNIANYTKKGITPAKSLLQAIHDKGEGSDLVDLIKRQLGDDSISIPITRRDGEKLTLDINRAKLHETTKNLDPNTKKILEMIKKDTANSNKKRIIRAADQDFYQRLNEKRELVMKKLRNDIENNMISISPDLINDYIKREEALIPSLRIPRILLTTDDTKKNSVQERRNVLKVDGDAYEVMKTNVIKRLIQANTNMEKFTKQHDHKFKRNNTPSNIRSHLTKSFRNITQHDLIQGHIKLYNNMNKDMKLDFINRGKVDEEKVENLKRQKEEIERLIQIENSRNKNIMNAINHGAGVDFDVERFRPEYDNLMTTKKFFEDDFSWYNKNEIQRRNIKTPLFKYEDVENTLKTVAAMDRFGLMDNDVKDKSKGYKPDYSIKRIPNRELKNTGLSKMFEKLEEHGEISKNSFDPYSQDDYNMLERIKAETRKQHLEDTSQITQTLMKVQQVIRDAGYMSEDGLNEIIQSHLNQAKQPGFRLDARIKDTLFKEIAEAKREETNKDRAATYVTESLPNYAGRTAGIQITKVPEGEGFEEFHKQKNQIMQAQKLLNDEYIKGMSTKSGSGFTDNLTIEGGKLVVKNTKLESLMRKYDELKTAEDAFINDINKSKKEKKQREDEEAADRTRDETVYRPEVVEKLTSYNFTDAEIKAFTKDIKTNFEDVNGKIEAMQNTKNQYVEGYAGDLYKRIYDETESRNDDEVSNFVEERVNEYEDNLDAIIKGRLKLGVFKIPPQKETVQNKIDISSLQINDNEMRIQQNETEEKQKKQDLERETKQKLKEEDEELHKEMELGEFKSRIKKEIQDTLKTKLDKTQLESFMRDKGGEIDELEENNRIEEIRDKVKDSVEELDNHRMLEGITQDEDDIKKNIIKRMKDDYELLHSDKSIKKRKMTNPDPNDYIQKIVSDFFENNAPKDLIQKHYVKRGRMKTALEELLSDENGTKVYNKSLEWIKEGIIDEVVEIMHKDFDNDEDMNEEKTQEEDDKKRKKPRGKWK